MDEKIFEKSCEEDKLSSLFIDVTKDECDCENGSDVLSGMDFLEKSDEVEKKCTCSAQPESERAINRHCQGKRDALMMNIESPSVYPVRKSKFEFYKLYKERLQTFSTWPKYLYPRPQQLASAGFFHTALGDVVKCFHCGITLKNWSPQDEVWKEHSRWSPSCGYIKMVQII